MKLSNFYFAHDELFLIPIEHLTPTGMSETFSAAVQDRREVDAAWVSCFNKAYTGYHQRAAALFQRAPANWFPPRAQNVAIVTDAAATRPYFQVFPQASWLLYQSDFEPVDGSPELAIYKFFHAERAGLSRNLVDAFSHNLSYFLTRSREDMAHFREQAANDTRPDADAFRALVQLLDAALGPHLDRQRIFHPSLHPAPDPLAEPCGRVEAADLQIARSLQPALKELAQTINATSRAVVQRYLAVHASPSFGNHTEAAKHTTPTIEMAPSDLAHWLSDSKPRVLLLVEGKPLWDPEQPQDTAAVEARAASMGARPRVDFHRDLALIDEYTRKFFAAVKDPSALPRDEQFEQGGGVYVNEARQLIAYDAAEASLNRLNEGSAPYHRWLLGARVMHEWGHLAVEAGWVAVPAALKEQEEQARQDVALLLRRLVNEAPPACRDVAVQEQAMFGGAGVDPGEAWMQYLFTRMPDYQTNLLARRLLRPEELESYVRVNVRCHAHDGIGPYQQLMRYAFEYQYLSLSVVEDPLAYFLRSTWFEPLFIQPGIVALDRMQALWRAVARVCQCQRIDESAFVDGALNPA